MKLKKYSKYKNSWIDWIWEIPEDWEVRRLKFINKLQWWYAFKSENFSEEWNNIIRIWDIKDNVDFDNTKKYPNSIKIHKDFKIKNNDVLIALTWATIGKVWKVNNYSWKAYINQRVAKLSWINNYYYYLLKSDFIRKQIELIWDWSAQENISNWQIEDFFIPFNHKQEQVSSFLDSKTAQIEKLIEKDRNLIELLKEKRISLINQAVTKGLKKEVMFDTNSFDKFNNLSNKEQLELLKRIKIIATHIQEDELLDDKKELLNIAEKIPTSGWIWEKSKWNNFKWWWDNDEQNINTIIGNWKKEKHSNDALIANTSKNNNLTLITNDKRLIKRATDINLEAISFEYLIKVIKRKDSWVDWIWEIPESWEIRKLKWLLKSVQIWPFWSMIKSDNLVDNWYKIYWQENLIKSDFSLWQRFIDDNKFKELIKYKINSWDVLVSMMWTIWECEIFPGNISTWILDSHLMKLVVWKKLLNTYLQIIFSKSKYIFWQLLYMNKWSIMQGLNSTIIKEIIIALPTIEEQQEIVDFLDRETVKINNHIKKVERRIELYEEYKKSLIYNVVTGKVEV